MPAAATTAAITTAVQILKNTTSRRPSERMQLNSNSCFVDDERQFSRSPSHNYTQTYVSSIIESTDGQRWVLLHLSGWGVVAFYFMPTISTSLQHSATRTTPLFTFLVRVCYGCRVLISTGVRTGANGQQMCSTVCDLFNTILTAALSDTSDNSLYLLVCVC